MTVQSPTEDGLSSNAELFLTVPEPVPVKKVPADAMTVQGKMGLRREESAPRAQVGRVHVRRA